jgi:hypothetical protein
MNELNGSDHQSDPERDIQQPPAAVERANPAANDTASSNQPNKKESKWPQ